ncbi:acyl-CoA dehydrogenase family protein [Streptomyces sp. NPDC052396]|uniref:acyl-CoA dehydrogenase family protein n=1 Tax=Streptomyces sp. NPDC052396 TaxID=3365689 RepID=UPI0037D5D011
MDFAHTEAELEFRDRVRTVLSDCPDRSDEPLLYRKLGTAGLLGADWPTAYGGRDAPSSYTSIVSEELVRAGVPDTLFINSVLTVGRLLLRIGTEEQKTRLLPGIARGESFAGVLYTEADAGSDLAGLTTSATAVAGGFEISGTKVFGLKSPLTDVGLCAARTTEHDRYGGLTLFLVDMHAPGVHITELDSVPDEPFHVVTLDRVAVTGADVVGGLGNGWSVLAEALPLERMGFDFALRAERWYALGRSAPEDPCSAVESARYAARVEAARLLSWRASATLDAVHTSTAKWYGGELAAELALWALTRYGPEAPAEIDRAWREAPGLRLSGGTSEMMLQTLAEHLPDLVD